MRFRRPSTSDIDMGTNIINLVDVLLLLLIFFMITTTFNKKSELNVQLPEATGVVSQQESKHVEITITANGHYTVNDRSLVNTELETLKAALREVAQGDTSQALIITADGNTPHQAVVRAMDAAGQLGFSHLSLSTQSPPAQQ